MPGVDQLFADFFELLKNKGPEAWVALILASLVLTGLAKSLLRILQVRLEKLAGLTVSPWDDMAVDLIGRIRVWAIFVWISHPLLQILAPPAGVLNAARTIAVIATSAQICILGMAALRLWHEASLKRRIKEDASSAAVLGLLYLGVQTVFLSLVLLLGLSGLGIDIAALLAGLGVGGIAVALAAQNVLGDVLASLSIVLDKPFIVGDFVVVGNDLGNVEHIGIKTTRLRSLSGEQIVVSNKDMLESRIKNYKRMWERRVVQRFGVTYSTEAEKLKRIPQMVKEIIAQYPKLRLDRCHFFQYGSSSLDFELVFFVSDPDYNIFMDFQEKLLLDIFNRFAAEKVEFAYPTQTVYLHSPPLV